MKDIPSFQYLSEYYSSLFDDTNQNLSNNITYKVAQCKTLARQVKVRQRSRYFPADINHSLPSHQVMSQLVELYFSTFESCYRVLYFPLFLGEFESYVNEPGSADPSFRIQLLLVMALAGTVYHDSNIRTDIVRKARKWVFYAQTWLFESLDKARLTLRTIQIHCLLLLARQVTRLQADLAWISAGSVLRMAMQMGLHQDPDCLGEMEMCEKEIRRRIWYTILEMEVQSALDSGMTCMISDKDYNTRLPSIVNDSALKEGLKCQQSRTGRTANLRVNFQPILANSIPLRLRAVRIINSLQSEPLYDEVLALGDKLTSVCYDAAISPDKPTALTCDEPLADFASCYCSHLLRRFLLCLHFRYGIRAKTNPRYSYSQKVCLDTALDILSFLNNDLYCHLLLTGGGMFRDLTTRGAMFIFLELISEPKAHSGTLSEKRSLTLRESLISEARRVVEYARDRLLRGDTNVKVYVGLSMMLTQAESQSDSPSTKEAVLGTLQQSLDTSYHILDTMASGASESDTQPLPDMWRPNDLMGWPADQVDEFDLFENENYSLGFVPMWN